MPERSEKKLSAAEKRWLDKICRTNGGGVAVAISGVPPKPVLSLYDRGLIQGKSGQQYCAVHTREGMTMWRSLKDSDNG